VRRRARPRARVRPWRRLGNRVGSARVRGPASVVVEDDSLNPTAARLDPGTVGVIGTTSVSRLRSCQLPSLMYILSNSTTPEAGSRDHSERLP
jgi:hypothetical protein